jgi:hypothetical protein
MPDEHARNQRSYGCTFGCGNPYDYVVISVMDGTTEFLCIPCYIRLAVDMVTAMASPDDPEVRKAVELAKELMPVTFDNGQVKTRGHNAPVAADDPDIFAAFDSVITEDELPEEFR